MNPDREQLINQLLKEGRIRPELARHIKIADTIDFTPNPPLENLQKSQTYKQYANTLSAALYVIPLLAIVLIVIRPEDFSMIPIIVLGSILEYIAYHYYTKMKSESELWSKELILAPQHYILNIHQRITLKITYEIPETLAVPNTIARINNLLDASFAGIFIHYEEHYKMLPDNRDVVVFVRWILTSLLLELKIPVFRYQVFPFHPKPSEDSAWI